MLETGKEQRPGTTAWDCKKRETKKKKHEKACK
jgi:hypothetical protein